MTLAPSRSAQARVRAEDGAIGVYVHWPFCAQKCPYCDFNSHVRTGGWDEAQFLAAYEAEIAAMRERTGSRKVTSIFLGGGTPSLMRPETVGGIIARIDAAWGLTEGCEITLEGNPNSVEAGRFRGYRDAGVNRVSVGVQALRENDLRRLGRVHSVAEARRAVEIANAVFDRVSFDLIYAREGQTADQWRDELAEALAMAAGHLSLYQLTIEPGTPFQRWHAAGRLAIPDDETAARLYDITQEMTASAGLPVYETSNHARPGEESRHNLVYWRYAPYVGVGPGAHGRIPLRSGEGRIATSCERNPEQWKALVLAQGHGVVEAEALSPEAMADEMVLMGLRLAEGLDLEGLARLTGLAPSAGVLEALLDEGLVSLRPGRAASPPPDPVRAARFLAVEPAGRLVLDHIILRLSNSLAPVSAASRA